MPKTGLALGLAVLAAAQGMAVHPQTAEEMLSVSDTNGDGRISREEWHASAWQTHVAQWGAAEARGIAVDKVVEALCHGNSRCAPGAAMFVAAIDRNHDGYVDRRESDLNSDNLFWANDLNHDGYVTVEEMTALASRSSPK
jgi:Ca2+-binding EF-hand superfamily protein